MAIYRNYPDVQLSELFIDGDPEAYTETYNRYAQSMLAFAYRNIKNREDSIDMVFEIFTDLWRSRHNIWVPNTLPEFLISIVTSRALAYHRDHIFRRSGRIDWRYYRNQPLVLALAVTN